MEWLVRILLKFKFIFSDRVFFITTMSGFFMALPAFYYNMFPGVYIDESALLAKYNALCDFLEDNAELYQKKHKIYANEKRVFWPYEYQIYRDKLIQRDIYFDLYQDARYKNSKSGGEYSVKFAIVSLSLISVGLYGFIIKKMITG